MGIFDFDSDEPRKPDKKQSAVPDVKQTEMRKMSGFSDIGDVARNAPTNLASEPPTQTGAPRARRVTAQDKRASKEEQEKAEKMERQRQALNTIGKRYCKMMADAPYEMWARFAQDDFLRLTPEEANELSGAYFELLNALEPDLTSPWVIAGGIVFMNMFMVGKRLKHLQEVKEKEEALEKDHEPETTTNATVKTQ